MEKLEIDKILNNNGVRVYFVGIGGIAMSAVAGIVQNRGFVVLGSDSKGVYAPAKDVLEKYQIKYTTGYSRENIEKVGAELYVLSAGEDQNNPEVQYLLEKDLPRCGLAELLFNLYRDKLRVVVTGTHGKSTTAGLIGHVLKNVDDSSFMTGAVLKDYLTNFYDGSGNYAVFEGDEYKEQFDDPTPKFQFYKPDILVLTNLEYDHPDMFAHLEQLETEFAELIAALPPDGLIVYNADDARLTKLVHESNVSSVSFGIDNDADYHVENIKYGSDYTTIEIMNKFSKQVSSKLLGQTEQYKIQIPGKINVYNALAGIAMLRALGFQQEQIALDLLAYQGVKRRFEVVGNKNGVTLVDDYAHHPTAVRETLEAAKLKYPNSKIWAVFEPHTFSRTKATLSELVKSFDAADEVLISEIYPARESEKNASIKSSDVVEALSMSPLFYKEGARESSKQVRLVHDKQEAMDILKSELKPGDVLIVMAVGNFNRLAYELKEVL